MSDYHNPPGGPSGYDYTPPQPPEQPQRRKGVPWWGWLLIVLGVLLTLCIIVGAVSSAAGDSELTRRTRPVETTQPVPSAEEAEPAAAPEPAPEPESELSVSQEQAIISAESYLTNVGGFSRSGLIGQLEFEGFSTEEAEFAVDFVEVDWMEQAVISAQSYMDNVGGFSRQSLIDQLEFEGFTEEQAEHGVNEVGL